MEFQCRHFLFSESHYRLNLRTKIFITQGNSDFMTHDLYMFCCFPEIQKNNVTFNIRIKSSTYLRKERIPFTVCVKNIQYNITWLHIHWISSTSMSLYFHPQVILILIPWERNYPYFLDREIEGVIDCAQGHIVNGHCTGIPGNKDELGLASTLNELTI